MFASLQLRQGVLKTDRKGRTASAPASVSPVEILSKDTRQKRGHAKGIIPVDVLPISARGSGSLGELALHRFLEG